MSVDRLPTYSVAELNTAIGSLLERGFAPRFLLEATVSRPQLKKGHLWLTLTDRANACDPSARTIQVMCGGRNGGNSMRPDY